MSGAVSLDADFRLLLSRDPYVVRDGKLADAIQSDVLKYFNNSAQYHMEPGLRSRFISAGVPDVSPKLRPLIAGSDAETFYRSLSVPYVALTLQRSTDPAVKWLNVTRAERRIGDTMRNSKVYRTQTQAFYALAWQERYPEVARLKDDQRQNSRTYKERAEEDLTAFIDAQCGSEDENARKLVRSFMKKYLETGKAGKYWAFRALLNYLSNDNLKTLDPTSDAHGEITDPANPSRKLLRQCAVLNTLDESGQFATFLQDMVRHHLLSIALPQKMDFQANEKELGLVCREVLAEFLEQASSLGPEYDSLRRSVELLMQKEEGQRNLDEMFAIFFGSMTSSGTSRSLDGWLRNYLTTAELQQFGFVRRWSPRVGLMAVNSVRLGALTMALGSILLMMTNGISWGQMSAKERTATVVAGVDLLLVTAPKVLSLGVVTMPDLWTSLTSWVKARTSSAGKLTRSLSLAEVQTVEIVATRSRSLSTTALLRAEKIGVQVEGGLRQWLTGEMRSTAAVASRQALIAGKAGENVTFVRRFFGRNLDHFMATRVGLVLAISGLALSIWGLATAKDNKERWINGALTAAAAMEVCSIAIGVMEVGGVVGRIGSFLGPIGLVVTVAAVGYMIYDALSKEPPPSLIRQFVENEAKAAGLHMPYEMDIDYLASGESLHVGVGVSVTVADRATDYLRLDLEGSPCSLRSNPAMTDHDADTVFDLDVDGQGGVTLISRGFSADADPYTGAPERKRKPTVLRVGATGQVVADDIGAAEDDPDSCLWQSAILGMGVKTDGKPKSGRFTLRNQKTKSYLAVLNGAVGLSDAAFPWVVTTGVPMRKRFTYSTSRLDATQMDIGIEEDQAGARPITWEAQNLPDFLSLTDDGALKVDDAKLRDAEKKKTWQFTVTATNPGGRFSSRVDLRYQDDWDEQVL